MSTNVFLVAGARTPMCEYESGRRGDGKPGGLLAGLSALDLGALAATEAIKRSGLAPADIDQAIFGNALQTSNDAIYGARHVALKAGVPNHVPALTVNRICGSGIQSIVSMSQAPHVMHGLRGGLRLGQGKLEDLLMAALLDPYCGFYMAQTAENIAKRMEISRQDQDEYAVRSQKAAEAAYQKNLFKDEIVPVEVKQGRNSLVVDQDDHMRFGTTMDDLAKLPAAFSKDGSVTAGNASGIVDGGAAVVLASEEVVKAKGLKPLARIVNWSFVGVEPEVMGMGPVPAIQDLLKRENLKIGDIDLFEINEAFAAQYLGVERGLGLDRNKVNVNGGAIALGHPLGATGTRITLTLALELIRRGAKRGISSACIGGGQGIALLIEAV
ncbi:MAG: acetyl-CoA C-acetyltransferase [bacterium]|nr:MAG: acetyl-CoA C-acetyltransferase [bacterium]